MHAVQDKVDALASTVTSFQVIASFYLAPPLLPLHCMWAVLSFCCCAAVAFPCSSCLAPQAPCILSPRPAALHKGRAQKAGGEGLPSYWGGRSSTDAYFGCFTERSGPWHAFSRPQPMLPLHSCLYLPCPLPRKPPHAFCPCPAGDQCADGIQGRRAEAGGEGLPSYLGGR